MSKQDGVLRLTLKKQWFDMIASGEKPEEYRELKKSMIEKLFDLKKLDATWEEMKMQVHNKLYYSAFGWNTVQVDNFFQFEKAIFTNGYGHNKPKIEADFKGLWFGYGNPECGAPALDPVFIIKFENAKRIQ